jgi:hypothetical protein
MDVGSGQVLMSNEIAGLKRGLFSKASETAIFFKIFISHLLEHWFDFFIQFKIKHKATTHPLH